MRKTIKRFQAEYFEDFFHEGGEVTCELTEKAMWLEKRRVQRARDRQRHDNIEEIHI